MEPLRKEDTRAELTNLNTQLADYIRNVRAMRVTSARALGTTHYGDMLQRMEGELLRIRDSYESELDRMRDEVKDANATTQSLQQKLLTDRGRGVSTQKR